MALSQRMDAVPGAGGLLADDPTPFAETLRSRETPMVGRLRIVGVVMLALLLGGCVGGVKLRHPATGKEVACGPYALKFGIGLSGA